jgi:electron-transferring-flavoprotein dehydrogenase
MVGPASLPVKVGPASLPVKPDHWMLRRRRAEGEKGRRGEGETTADGKITFDRVTDVFHSGTKHAEDQPCHLIVPDLRLCVERCSVDFGNPCQRFCPAAVYEWVKDASQPGDKGHLVINPGNCVHCKTCDIKDPYENILWAVPEGGGGPRYRRQ